jgi:hypothetical protein
MSSIEVSANAAGRTGLRVIAGNSSRRRAEDHGIVHEQSQNGLYTWTYTTALINRFDHPEILVAGLDPFLANSVLAHLTELISHGQVYFEGSSSESALPQLSCVFRSMASFAADILMPSLGGEPALQLIYPDRDNRLPWQSGHRASWRSVQPLFLAGGSLGEAESRFFEAAMHRPLKKERRYTERPELVDTNR